MLFWLSISTTQSQEFDTATWLTGHIITVEGDTLDGKLHISSEFMQVVDGQMFRALQPSQVKSYLVMDPTLGVPRNFSRYETEGVLRPEFYEQLIVGPWHFLIHISEYYFYVYEPNYFRSSNSDDSWVQRKRQRVSGTYYLWDGQDLYKIGPFKKFMKQLSGRYWPLLADFAREHQLNYGKAAHQARIIDFYNHLYYRDQASSTGFNQ